MNRKIKKLIFETTSWVTIIVLIFTAVSVVLVPHASATTSGKIDLTLNPTSSDANETYNSMSLGSGGGPSSGATASGSSIAHVQSNTATGSGASPTVNFTGTPTHNNLLVAYVFSDCINTAISMVSTGWTPLTTNSAGANCNANAREVQPYYKIAGVSESSTVTAADNASAHWAITVAEYSGIDTVNPLDGTIGGTGENSRTFGSGVNATPSISQVVNYRALMIANISVKASASFSNETFTSMGTDAVHVRQATNTASVSSEYFDTILGATPSAAEQGTATPSVNAVGASDIVIFKAAATQSTTNIGATPPTSFCEASNLTNETITQINVDATTASVNRCLATFISSPLVGAGGASISLSTGDTNSIAGSFTDAESNSGETLAMHFYLYRWNGSGTTVSSGDEIADLSCTDPSNFNVTCSATATPLNNVTFNAGDRLVAIASMTVTAAVADSIGTLSLFSNHSITMSYTTYGYNSSNKPSLAGSLDEDFTTDVNGTPCTGSPTYNTKWTCQQPSAASSAALINAGGLTSPTGDESGWLELYNFNGAATPISDFGSTPSNSFLYQTLPGDYGNGNITTVLNQAPVYTGGYPAFSAASPYNHSALTLWGSNTDYLEVQVYADGAINDTGTNTVKVALNNSGSLSGATSLNTSTTGNGFSNVWLRFADSNGSYQAQYSLDGSSFTNVGSPVTHDAFVKTGLDTFSAMSGTDGTYAGSFEFFNSTLTSATYNQDAYIFDTNADSTTPGSALAANNTVYTLTSAGQAFRLRLGAQITGQSNAGNTPPSFKLQYVGKGVGTCAAPSGGTPSSYTDVTTATLIAYKDNATPADEANIATASGKDPTGAGTNIAQTYQELNNFSAGHTNLNNSNDGVWDFSLFDNTATTGPSTDQLLRGGEWFNASAGTPSTAYCLRVVTSGGSALTTYTNYPQITTFGTSLTTGKQGFFWSN